MSPELPERLGSEKKEVKEEGEPIAIKQVHIQTP